MTIILQPVYCLLLLQGLAAGGQEAAVADYIKAASTKSERERSELQKDKTGVFTGEGCAAGFKGRSPCGV
jgi:leucyl-tRNA synthetase